VIALLPALARAGDDREFFFETSIRPLLVAKCQKCHGPAKSESALRVDSRAALLAGGDRGPAIILDKPDDSPLLQAVSRVDPNLAMPPDKPLARSEIAAISQWIKTGAHWPAGPSDAATTAKPTQQPSHWAFQPVRATSPPPDPTGWSDTPVDRFIATQLLAKGLEPVAEADRRTLIRRLSFDLLGLPPTPNEVEAFVADLSASAWSRLIDRMLASPHYGERWGRHWMDVVHYADTAGDNADYPVPEAAKYRDYIIQSFNNDKPYDQFVQEQLAGDLMPADSTGQINPDRRIATTFLALARRYGTGPFELWHLTLEDAIDTTGRAFMGLTLRCARCHDHKFDPISQRDYYALHGMFASTQFPWAGAEEFVSKKFPRMNFVPLVDSQTLGKKTDGYKKTLTELEQTIKGWKEPKTEEDRRRLQAAERERTRLVRTALPLDVPLAYAVTEGPAADAALQRRGEPSNPGPAVPRGTPSFAFWKGEPVPPTKNGSGRLEFAQWLTRPDNPLTARVIVNRIWQYHFGRGLAATPSNFGIRGDAPTHPELLDYLANQLVKNHWSIKSIHREILLSRVYRLSTQASSAAASTDPDNRLLWRHTRRRLEAESIRDAMLAVSGQLDLQMAGQHPFPPIEAWGWTQHDAFKALYPTDRRSVYLMTQRLMRHPFLALFDSPDTNVSTDLRSNATVPLQALYLMNNPFIEETAQAFAKRLLSSAPTDDARIATAYQTAWSRLPEHHERERAARFLHQYRSAAQATSTPVAQANQLAWTSLAKILLTANEFLYVD
jgi:hypothetical protein